jgi:hypothetical protein
MVRDHWGEIRHPTIDEIVLMILRAADCYGWENIKLWKLDLKGAFHLVDIAPEDVRLMAYELTDDLTMFYTRGMFGWTGSPFMFQVITRVLHRLITRDINGVKIVGEIVMYVDDIMGVSPIWALDSDITIAMERILGLLGPKSLADDKREVGRALDMIGWRIDLDDRIVTMADHNMRRTMFGFMSVNLEKGKIQYAHALRLASYASRYVLVCRYMAPFCGDLHGVVTGRSSDKLWLDISPGLRWSIELWRVFLFLLRRDGRSYRRDLGSFAKRPPDLVIEFDACLTGLGIIINLMKDGTMVCIKAISIKNLPFDLGGDASYQNAMEFMCLPVALALIVSMGAFNQVIEIRGDSISALKWGSTDRFRTMMAQNVAIVFVAIGTRYDLRIEEAVHVPGTQNILCDELSRNETPESKGLPRECWLNNEEISIVMNVIELCNPLVSHQNSESFFRFYRAVDQYAESLGAPLSA